jgi:LPXTG-site transpeptidase (sortase) family protein
MIVNPEDVWVLDRTERPALTLITCYPFSYVGHAPQRFVVRAERVDSARSHRVS